MISSTADMFFFSHSEPSVHMSDIFTLFLSYDWMLNECRESNNKNLSLFTIQNIQSSRRVIQNTKHADIYTEYI